METGFVILVFAVAVIGVIIGIFIGRSMGNSYSTQGVINVDYSDPDDGPYLFLELNTSIADVVSKKQAIFDVRIKSYVSRE